VGDQVTRVLVLSADVGQGRGAAAGDLVRDLSAAELVPGLAA
jgi:hypothetical protein